MVGHLLSAHLQQPQRLDADRLEKIILHCKSRLSPSAQEELDVSLAELASLKHSELQAALAVVPP